MNGARRVDGVGGDALRELVREALREALPDLLPQLAAGGGDHGGGTRWVSVRDDADLARFAEEVLRLADDPRDGPLLRSGAIRFRLAGGPARAASGPPPAAPRPEPEAARRVERGPVTERHVRDAEAAGVRRLVLGRAAVLTPMARDRARTAGVEIVRETAADSRRDR